MCLRFILYHSFGLDFISVKYDVFKDVRVIYDNFGFLCIYHDFNHMALSLSFELFVYCIIELLLVFMVADIFNEDRFVPIVDGVLLSRRQELNLRVNQTIGTSSTWLGVDEYHTVVKQTIMT